MRLDVLSTSGVLNSQKGCPGLWVKVLNKYLTWLKEQHVYKWTVGTNPLLAGYDMSPLSVKLKSCWSRDLDVSDKDSFRSCWYQGICHAGPQSAFIMDLWSLINKGIDCPSCQEARAAAAFDSVWVSSPSLQASTICVSNVHIVCSLPNYAQKALDSMRYFLGDKKKD